WRIDSRENYNKTTLKDCSLSILKHFDSDHEWILKPGDMLYLPPNMPHYGIAQDDNCMTLSVGFRAPSQRELIYNWVDSMLNNPKFNQRYRDKERVFQPNSAEISEYDVEQLTKIIREGVDDKKDSLSVWLGKYLTETRGDSALNLDNKGEQLQDEQIANYYERTNWLRLAFIEEKHTIHFFADGKHFSLDKDAKEAIDYLCNNHTYKKSFIKKYYKQPGFKVVFNQLLQGNGIN
ncbi:MAG: AraC family ligand binding domain-containing protein, partial [Cocleimonas sp.]|nr:AraC family ligand binding domain-containing protein [Cocleimonas sp.]